MNSSERQNRIVEYLRIKPISHGQVYTFQIAIPSQIGEIPLERREALKSSLTEQGSNLIPLIVRRTEVYSEEEEYEVVYGFDWCIVAKEIDTEKLWVWVFDMTDEQAAAAKAQMEQLVGSTGENLLSDETQQIKNLVEQLDKLFKSEVKKHKKQIAQSFKELEALLNKQLEVIIREVDGTEPEKPDYLSMTVPQLRAMVQERGIKVSSRRKADFIAALEKADAS